MARRVASTTTGSKRVPRQASISASARSVLSARRWGGRWSWRRRSATARPARQRGCARRPGRPDSRSRPIARDGGGRWSAPPGTSIGAQGSWRQWWGDAASLPTHGRRAAPPCANRHRSWRPCPGRGRGLPRRSSRPQKGGVKLFNNEAGISVTRRGVGPSWSRWSSVSARVSTTTARLTVQLCSGDRV
jgi:hypothetical protein